MHMIADTLSGAPVFQPEGEEEETLETAFHCLQVRETSKLSDIKEAIDEHYHALVQAIKTDTNFKQLPGYHPARKHLGPALHSVAGPDGRNILDGRRLMASKGARRSIIQELHRADSGMTKTFKTARQLYFWPNMKEDLHKAIDGCQLCQKE